MGMEKPCGEPKQPSQLSVWSSSILKASFCLSAKPPVQCNHSAHSRYKKNHMTKPEIVGNTQLFSVCMCTHTQMHVYIHVHVCEGRHTYAMACSWAREQPQIPILAFCLLSSAVYTMLAGSEAHRDPSVSTSQLTTRERHYRYHVLPHLALLGPEDLNPSLHLTQEPFPPPINCSFKPLNSRGSLGGSNNNRNSLNA